MAKGSVWPKERNGTANRHPNLRVGAAGSPHRIPYGPERGALAMRRPKRPSDGVGGFSRAKGGDPPAAAPTRPPLGTPYPTPPTYGQRVAMDKAMERIPTREGTPLT